MNWISLIIIAIFNIPMYLYLGKIFFEDWQGFCEAIRFWLTPEIISAFRGEYWEDVFSELKLFVYLICCALIVFAEYQLIMRIFT